MSLQFETLYQLLFIYLFGLKRQVRAFLPEVSEIIFNPLIFIFFTHHSRIKPDIFYRELSMVNNKFTF